VSARKLLPLGLAVTALLVLAAIASHGRPLSGGRGRGPTSTFFDYVATTLVIFGLVTIAVVIWSLFSKREGGRPPRERSSFWSSVVTLFAGAMVAWLLVHSGALERLRGFNEHLKNGQASQSQLPARPPPAKNVRDPRLRWDEIGIVVALLAGTAVVLLASRQVKRAPRPLRLSRGEAVSAALDESLDDLRNDPDLRRAIVAAYARMEHALAGAGLPRLPSEAPFEYVERALASLDTSADSVRRLTGLFEWAKFSQHEPEPEMRDEAIDALVAVRDELRRPEREVVPA
jgi:hypothetical protein